MDLEHLTLHSGRLVLQSLPVRKVHSRQPVLESRQVQYRLGLHYCRLPRVPPPPPECLESRPDPEVLEPPLPLADRSFQLSQRFLETRTLPGLQPVRQIQ